jgi:hypothetical protein
MERSMIGIEGNAILLDRLVEARGEWIATVYRGEKEYNDSGRCITPVLARFRKTNLITTVGKQLVLDRLFGIGGPPAAISGTAVGTSATAAAVGDTTITGAVYKAFASTPTRSGLSVTAITSYTTAEANIAINEAGLLTASGGILFNRVAPFLSFTKTSAVALDITTVITQS